tara:strand:+ start:246 stop:377 length:132 start_codon:yes stop_codon:yes gene_type:complete
MPLTPPFCQALQEYGCPGSVNEDINLTPNSDQSSSNASTAGTP